MKYIIAGHHDKDSGAAYNNREETKETKKARELLLGHLVGEKVVVDKDWETNPQVQNRIKPGEGSVLLDIHFNAGSPTATGVECLVNRKDFADKNSLSYQMADEICKATSEVLDIRNRGVKCESATRHGKLGILNLGAGCSVLWEVCFISSVLDMQKWDLKQKELMKKIAEILQKYDERR